MVCVSEWVRQKIQAQTGVYDQEIVPNGVDLNQFYGSTKIERDSQCFGFVFSEEYIKGVDIMIGALTLAKTLRPDIRAVAFGTVPGSKAIALPSWVEYYESPPQEFIRQIYSQCSAWLFGSRSEGFGLPILEAMACKTPVIATPAGAATELVSNTCGYIVETSSPEEMSQRIIEFSEMNSIDWTKISESAFQRALQSDWNSSCSKLEDILINEIA
jgi:glycosyltransferase involved in cell wall biosynthesis